MSDLSVTKTWEPHRSHDMGQWRSAVITLISEPRFGRIRSCRHCHAEEAETVAGHRAHAELEKPCKGQP